jgi:hypothetical protein
LVRLDDGIAVGGSVSLNGGFLPFKAEFADSLLGRADSVVRD